MENYCDQYEKRLNELIDQGIGLMSIKIAVCHHNYTTKQNEAFGCMNEKSKGYRKAGEDMDKRIGKYNRKVGAQVESRSKARIKDKRAPNMA